MWIAYLADAASIAAPSSVGDIFQYAIGAFNLGILGWMCWLFLNSKLHSAGEVDRLRTEAERAVQAARTDLLREVEALRAEAARSVEAARVDLLRENEILRGEKQRVQEQRDDAMKFAQERLVPLLGEFTASMSSLLPILQQLTRYRYDDGPQPREIPR